ncbi:hypothetical protein [Catenulispora subtropica]|uniref:ATP-grasp domain-containing protein n=1 Tax=Catenulispora subtropica TaxID=450798 RepID=A0ABP5E7B2_9ACTN
MIIAAVEAPAFSLDRLVATAGVRGVRTRVVTRDADVRSPESDAAAGEELAVTLVNTCEIAGSPDPDAWSKAALTTAIGLVLDHQSPNAEVLTRNRAALRSRLYQHGLSRGPGFAFGPGASRESLLRSLTFPTVIRDAAGIADRAGWLVRSPADLDAVRAASSAGEMLGDVLTAEPYFDGPVWDVEVLAWGDQMWVRSVEPRSEAGFPAGRRADLNSWLSRVLHCVGFHRGFVHVEVALAGGTFEAVSIEISAGYPQLGEDLCRALDRGAVAVFGDLVLDRRPGSGPVAAGRTLLYAGDIGKTGAAMPIPEAVADPSGCVAVLLASGVTAESTLLAAMASSVAPYMQPQLG